MPRIPRIIPNLRWWIGGLLFASTVINYIDRQTLSVPAPHLKTEFHWSNSDFALLIIAFRIAYAVGQTIMGRFLDVVGTRCGLLYSVSWYSLAAMATSLADGLKSLSFFRFLLGCGEAANWPGATKVVSKWFPKSERGWAVALFDSGSAAGGAVAPCWLSASTAISVAGAQPSSLPEFWASPGFSSGSASTIRRKAIPISVRPNAQ